MGVLPDHKLIEMGANIFNPFDVSMVQPASVDVCLDRFFYRAQSKDGTYTIDPSNPNDDGFEEMLEVPEGSAFTMRPRDFVLASTFERITVPTDLIARFEGKSSLARLGLLTHITAGFIDPGFSGRITLELKNVTNFKILLYPGMKIGQVCFEELSEPVQNPYGSDGIGSHYQDQAGPTLSKSYINFNKANVYGQD